MYKNPIKWATALKSVYNGETVECPSCKGKNVEHKFFANKKDNIGFAQFKCKDCGEEGHLSRVSFPAGVEVEEL